jgi:uncharacterized flavoprotein (TIGR03862 family)
MSAPLIVVGAGPAGLRAAETAARLGHAVHIHDRMPSPARKLLMAGLSGLNLTRDEPLDVFAARYGAEAARFAGLLADFSPADARTWAAGLGIETFAGTSGRVFPVGMKAAPLVRAWLRRLDGLGVRLFPRRTWRGWDGDALLFDGPDGTERVEAAATVLALGGASWPRLGTDGGWAAVLSGAGFDVAPFRPANMGFRVAWSEELRRRCEGKPVKSVALTFAGRRQRGEFVITGTGIEGGVVYTLSAALRDAIERDGRAALTLDLKPDLSEAEVLARLQRGWGAQSTANVLRKALRLDEVHAALLREGTPKETFRDPPALARAVKALVLELTGTAGLDRAISSAGGLRFAEVDEGLMLVRRPGVFAAGEMLDWEAPTGGYLIQGCLAAGERAGRAAAAWITARATADRR